MIRKILLASCCTVAALSLPAQTNIPVIRANSGSVDVRDGAEFRKDAWSIAPEINPDVYVTQKKNARVTFYTDLDSISFKVAPDKTYDFIILLNGKDTARTRIVYQPSYLDILKNAATYNTADTRPVPKFSYQSMDNPSLVALRQGFKLDSIAGEGSEVSKIINLLHWIHNLIPHDGNNGNPEVKNAMSMIAVCKQDKRGLNCRGLATVLNECYLSMGIPSRFITCMPKDSVFQDCHVINMVYASELNKWIWIDPTQNAYVMDEKGVLLGVEEVRERLIDGRMLILNPDANWNNKVTATKEDYLYNYMAKNLYRIECPLVSEYDTETWGKGRKVTYVELLPLDAYNQTPQYSERYREKINTTFVSYKTNNPKVFWALPEK